LRALSRRIPDGVTTVVGGIKQTREGTSNDRTPGLSKIPLLGWLFKRESKTTENQELLVFITPRIIR
jgi:type IV pilus assembly protein PilQ